jgi:hypothetical protein
MNGGIRQMMNNFISKLQETYGFEIVAKDYRPESFGNSCVELRSADLSLRIVRERGQTYLEVAPKMAPDDWHDAETVLQLLGMDTTPGAPCEIPEGCCEVLTANLAVVAEVLNGPRLGELIAFEQRRARERFL